MFAIPTTSGVATVTCFAPAADAAALAGDCTNAAASAQIADAIPLGPNAAYGEALSGGLGGLTAAREKGVAAMKGATPAAQAAAASTVAQAYTAAAAALGDAPAGPADAAAHAALLEALDAAGKAWGQVSSAAKKADASAYTKAKKAVDGAEGDIGAAIATLEKNGYSVGA